MRKIKYCSIVYVDNGDIIAEYTGQNGKKREMYRANDVMQLLNILGSKGWEIVSVYPIRINVTERNSGKYIIESECILKRVKN